MTNKIPISFLLAVVVLFSGFNAIAQDESRLSSLISEADALIADNNLNGALAKTREALNLSPEYHPALQKQINILFLLNNEKESIRLADEAVKKYPGNAGYHYLRGIINNSRGKYSRALEDFSKAIELDKSDLLYRSYLGRGVSYLNLLEYERALQDLNISIQHNDTVASAYYSRGRVNYELHEYEAAVADFSKILDFSAGNAALFFNLGMSYFRLNDKENACRNFNKSCSMGNTNACRMSLMECVKAIPTVP